MNRRTREPAVHHLAIARRVGLATLFVIAVDQASKATPTTFAAAQRNHELALGVAAPTAPLLIALAALGVLVVGAYAVAQAARRRWTTWIPALLIGGALSNLTDRILTGSVIDFIPTPWIVFNPADVALVAGVCWATWSLSKRRSVARNVEGR